MEKHTYSIGEFSKRTGVSIRTLHYYDELGLLVPEKHPSSGHRLYKDENVMTLQKIISLKFLGYSLENIGHMLNESRFTVDLTKTLNLHLQKLEDEKAIIEESTAAIKRIISVLEEEGEVSSPVFMSLISSMQSEKRQMKWLENHELDKLADLYALSEEEESGQVKQFIHFSNEMKRLYGKPVDNNEVQQLIAVYMQETFKFLDEETIQQLKSIDLETEKLQEFEDLLPVTPFTEEEEEWVGQAVDYYMEQNGMPGPTDD